MNISQLRYLYIYQEEVKFDIKLDICYEFPENLVIYDVCTQWESRDATNEDEEYEVEFGDAVYGKILGNITDVTHLEAQLIHVLKKN